MVTCDMGQAARHPFDTSVLVRFLDKLEREVRHPVTLIHLSDNGESYAYQGRPGWHLIRTGAIQTYQAPSGQCIQVYDFPQHYSIWALTKCTHDKNRTMGEFGQ